MEAFQFKTKKSKSLRHVVADEIRQAIINGQLKPGDRLREQDIAIQMSISRGPVREALGQLERDGLVINYPYKETVVAEITIEEIMEVLIPVRYTLESYAIKKALPNFSDNDLAELQAIIKEMERYAEQNDLSKLVDLDVAFHKFLIHKANQMTLNSLWDGIDMRIRLHFMSKGRNYSNLHRFPIEHQDLLSAIYSRNLDNILEELYRHLYDLNIN
jgi:DNA-binding GntR family transcriptional regulator